MPYIELIEQENKLRITLTLLGRDELFSHLDSLCANCRQTIEDHDEGFCVAEDHSKEGTLPENQFKLPAEVNFTSPHADILTTLLKDHLCNGWSMPSSAQIGALTSSPILVRGAAQDEQGYITSAEAVYWFPNYAIESELETLLRQGYVDFTRADEAAPGDIEPTFLCGLCGMILASPDADHNCS